MKPCAERNWRGMLRRGSGNAASAIVSMESRPTSPAPRSSELSSLRSLQLSSSFRGDVHPDSTIVNPCSQARRQTGVASSELRRRVRIWRYVHRHQWTSESHCSSSVSRRKAATQRAYRRLTLVHIVNPCSFARSGTGVILSPGTGWADYLRMIQFASLQVARSTRSCPDHHEGDLLIVWASTRWAARP